eukprot:1861451-Rhodomonas_salina.5
MISAEISTLRLTQLDFSRVPHAITSECQRSEAPLTRTTEFLPGYTCTRRRGYRDPGVAARHEPEASHDGALNDIQGRGSARQSPERRPGRRCRGDSDALSPSLRA